MEFLRCFLLLEILIWVVMTLTRLDSSFFSYSTPLGLFNCYERLQIFLCCPLPYLSLSLFWVVMRDCLVI